MEDNNTASPEGHEGQSSPDVHLCFLPAFEQWSAKNITWEEYLRHALLHWTGSKHEEDLIPHQLATPLVERDPIAFSIYRSQDLVTGVQGRSQLQDFALLTLSV